MNHQRSYVPEAHGVGGDAERLEHTALSLDDPSFRLDYYAL